MVGRWHTFAGALPYAVAPFTIAPEWVRRRFPRTGPPRPREGCTNAQSYSPDRMGHTPFGVPPVGNRRRSASAE
jgi:hypothetical protein